MKLCANLTQEQAKEHHNPGFPLWVYVFVVFWITKAAEHIHNMQEIQSEDIYLYMHIICKNMRKYASKTLSQIFAQGVKKYWNMLDCIWDPTFWKMMEWNLVYLVCNRECDPGYSHSLTHFYAHKCLGLGVGVPNDWELPVPLPVLKNLFWASEISIVSKCKQNQNFA